MAINADFNAYRRTVLLAEGVAVPIVVMPPLKAQRVTATGFYDIASDAEVLQFKNMSDSQTVYLRLNLDADSTAAATGDDQSVRVQAGEIFEFGLRSDLDATGYRLSVG